MDQKLSIPTITMNNKNTLLLISTKTLLYRENINIFATGNCYLRNNFIKFWIFMNSKYDVTRTLKQKLLK